MIVSFHPLRRTLARRLLRRTHAWAIVRRMHAWAIVLTTLLLARPLVSHPGMAGSSAACDCGRFTEELAAAEALFASRGEAVTLPLTDEASTLFRKRVDESYTRARCLAACESVPDLGRNPARVLVAAAAFKTKGLSPALARERLAVGIAAAERCLAIQPDHTICRFWHASSRGVVARDSWNPLQARLPRQLLEEFRAARDGAAPGSEFLDGAPTRGETAVLMRIPAVVGGDPRAARDLIERAAAAPRFACTLANRLLLAESWAKTGAPERAAKELRAVVADGLPSCGLQRYENALALETAARCLARLQARPTAEPGWNDDCT